MAFLEWRKFNFFDLKPDCDEGRLREYFTENEIVCTTSGYKHVVLGDSLGQIFIISRGFVITFFRGYEICVLLVQHLKNSPLLITVGEDEPGINPLIKVWDTSRVKNGIPHCCRIIRAIPDNRPVAAMDICVHEELQLMAIGFENGALILYRGDITRDRGSKRKVLHHTNSSVTGLAFKSTSAAVLLFVVTESVVLVYNVTHKDREPPRFNLDIVGCARKCSILAESIPEGHFMIGRTDAIYCYTIDGRGPCFAVDGEKVMLEWFRSYLIVVTNVNRPTTQTTTNQTAIHGHSITILDIQNKFIVFTATMNKIKAIVPEWGSLYIFDCNNTVYHLDEKDLQSKLSLLFKKNLYDISIRIAKSQQYDAEGLVDIFRQYGDHLYAKGDFWGAIEQYVKTIGRLEPSYVIKKFLDSQHIEKLTVYLQAVHKQGQATEDHTTLLLNCYTKLNKPEKLKEFILSKDRDLDFDVEIAIKVCRQASPQEALMLAKSHSEHDWYIKIQTEDHQNYKEALDYITTLDFTDAETYMKKYGQILIKYVPHESAVFLKHLCTGYTNKLNARDGVNGSLVNRSAFQVSDPEDYIHLFLNNSTCLVDFLEYLIAEGCILSTPVYDTLLEHYLHVRNGIQDEIEKNKYTQKILKLLQNAEIKYDKSQALVVCHMHEFSEGVLYLYEEGKLYQQILWYHMSRGDIKSVLTCCRKFDHQQPSLWVQALWSCIRKASDSSLDILPEILTIIAKERLLSPQLVIEAIGTAKSNITLGHIRSYVVDELTKEDEITNNDSELIKKYSADTKKLKEQLEILKNGVNVIQGSRCAACHHQLELPSLHFLCSHSYHQHCFQSFADNENECPACVPENKKLLELLKAQEYSRDLNETFHSHLEKASDGFSLAAEYFGRGVFKKVTVITDNPKEHKINALAEKENTIVMKSMNPFGTPFQNYGPGAEARLRQYENIKSGGSALTTALEGRVRLSEKQFSASVETKTKPNKVDKPVKVCNMEDYDESLNPFTEQEDQDDYDKNLNPFF